MKTNTFLILLLLVMKTALGFSQTTIPTIKAKNKFATVRIGENRYADAWEMSPNVKTDPADIPDEVGDKGVLFAIITDLDSVGFLIKRGQKQSFMVILNEKDTVWGRFVGAVPKATFTEAVCPECLMIVNTRKDNAIFKMIG